MKNWKNSVCALFAMMCVLIFAGCQPVPNGTKPITDTTTGTGGTKPTGTTPGSAGGSSGLNTVEKAIVGSFKLPDGIVFKFNSDRTGTKTTPTSGNIRAAQPVLNFTWKADTSGNVSITFKDGSASPVVKFDMNRPNEIKIGSDVAIKDGATDLNEYEQKLVGTWYGGGIEMELNEDKTVSSVFDPRLQGDISAKATWNSTANTLTLNWYEATRDGQILSGQEKEWVFDNFGGNPTVWKYTWKDNDNVTVNIRSEPELMSRKPYYNVFYTYDDVGGRVIKKEYVEIGKNYNIDFKYGEDCFKYVDIPQKYWKFEKYKITNTKFQDRLVGTEYKPGDSAIIPSPTAYQIYYLKICDTRDVIHIVYKVNGSREGDNYWFFDGNSYAKRNETWKSGSGSYTAKAGDIIKSAYIQNRESELKCIGWVDSSLNSISARNVYERADPEIAWSESSPIELVPVFAAQ